MQTLTRYVMLELIKVFALALAVLTSLFLLIGITTDLLPRGLGWQVVVGILPYLLPEAIRNASQGAVLYAVCNVYGRMAANNELVAIKSLGGSPLAVIKPAWVLAFLLSLTCVWLYDLGEVWGANGVRRVAVQSVERVVYDLLRSRREYSGPRLLITATGVEGKRVLQPTLTFRSAEEAEVVTIVASEAELRSSLVDMSLVLKLTKGEAYLGGELKFRFPDTIEYRMDLREASREDKSWRSRNQSLAEMQAEIDRLEPVASRSANSNGPRQVTEREILDSTAKDDPNQLTPAIARQRIHLLEAYAHRRWANGFFCLSYVLIGVPVAIRVASSNSMSSFFLCFLPVVVVNQPLHTLGIRMAQSGMGPPMCAWLGNVVLAMAGVVMLWRWRRF